MKFSLNIAGILFVSALFLFSSCRSEFEIIRTSNDPEKMLSEAHRLYKEKDYYKAITLYELLIPVYRGKTEAEDIAYNYAYAHYNQKKFISSSHFFKQFANTFANSDKKEEADFMAAYSHTQLSPTHKLDQTYSEKAIEALQVFINAYPESTRVQTCNELIDDMRSKMEVKSYESAKLYYKLKNYSSTIVSFENMLKDYPETEKEEEVRYLIAKSSFEFAQKSIYEKREERYMSAIEKCQMYLKKFPTAEKQGEISTFMNKSTQELNKIKNG